MRKFTNHSLSFLNLAMDSNQYESWVLTVFSLYQDLKIKYLLIAGQLKKVSGDEKHFSTLISASGMNGMHIRRLHNYFAYMKP